MSALRIACGNVEGVWMKKSTYNDRYSLNVKLSYTVDAMPIVRTISFSLKILLGRTRGQSARGGQHNVNCTLEP